MMAQKTGAFFQQIIANRKSKVAPSVAETRKGSLVSEVSMKYQLNFNFRFGSRLHFRASVGTKQINADLYDIELGVPKCENIGAGILFIDNYSVMKVT
jgi:hypothetical protein